MRSLGAHIAVALAVLAGCSSSPETQPPLMTVVEGLRGGQPDFAPRFVHLLRAEAPALEIGFVDQGTNTTALLERRDGPFEYWLTADGAHVVLQSGMLHSSRGFGEGLLASEIDAPLARIRSRQPGTADRFHTFLDGNDRAVTRTYRCLIESEGVRSIPLNTGPITVELMVETCRSLDQQFTNFYWVIPASGRIVQSRQWSGPTLGALSTRAVLP